MTEYRLRAYEKTQKEVKTQRKKFKVPYFECLIDGPIISGDPEELTTFFEKFNSYSQNVQIGLEFIQKKGEVKDGID